MIVSAWRIKGTITVRIDLLEQAWHLIAIMRENLQPNSRRQISLVRLAIDLTYQVQRKSAPARGLLHATPKRIFQMRTTMN
jgi:hypothetical protein